MRVCVCVCVCVVCVCCVLCVCSKKETNAIKDVSIKIT